MPLLPIIFPVSIPYRSGNCKPKNAVGCSNSNPKFYKKALLFVGCKRTQSNRSVNAGLKSFIGSNMSVTVNSQNILSVFLSEARDLVGLQLELQFVSDEGDELTVGGIALGVGNGVAEDALEGVQIFIALLVGLMPYDLLGYGYSTIESTKTQLFCICVNLYIQRVTRLRIYYIH